MSRPSARLLRTGAFVLVGLIALVVLVETRSSRELELARQAVSSGKTDDALTHFSRSLVWYLPFGPAEDAAGEMIEFGHELEKAGQEQKAFIAYSRARAGLYGARALYIPRPDLIASAEERLAAILAQRKTGPDAGEAEIGAQTMDYLKLYRSPPTPRPGPAAAAALGFAAWVLAAFLFIRQYSRPNADRRRMAWVWAAAFLAAYAVWLWGMKWA